MALVAMGTLVTDCDGFHLQRYVYPDGYLCKWLCPSIRNSDEKVWSNCQVLNRGDLPVKRPVGFERSALSNLWLVVVKARRGAEEEGGRRKEGGETQRQPLTDNLRT
jgi:hypothetical protein